MEKVKTEQQDFQVMIPTCVDSGSVELPSLNPNENRYETPALNTKVEPETPRRIVRASQGRSFDSRTCRIEAVDTANALGTNVTAQPPCKAVDDCKEKDRNVQALVTDSPLPNSPASVSRTESPKRPPHPFAYSPAALAVFDEIVWSQDEFDRMELSALSWLAAVKRDTPEGGNSKFLEQNTEDSSGQVGYLQPGASRPLYQCFLRGLTIKLLIHDHRSPSMRPSDHDAPSGTRE